jgi:hypothetical protein
VEKQRFEELAQAFGGDITRWPARLRDEASLLAAGEPEFARAVLSREDRLDAALDELPRVVAPAALFEAIVTTAPPLRRRWGWRVCVAPAGLGAGLAAVAAAGVVMGAQVDWSAGANTEASAQSVADLDVSYVSEVG